MTANSPLFLRMFALLLILPLAHFGCGGGGGDVVDATNGSAPVTAVYTATTISENGATLNGVVIPNGLSTDVWFEHGTDPSLSISTPTSPHQSIGSGLSAVPVSASIGGLTDNTIYYFRVCASNSKGPSMSSIQSFTTSSPGSPPATTTAAATSVGATTATLNGNVTANGLATDAWFEWGTSSTLSTFNNTAFQAVGSGTASQSVSAALTVLTTGATYYYRVAASNSSGTTKGTILSFTPGAAPVATSLAATSVGATTAILNGNVTANGLATDAWFEWGADSGLSSITSTVIQPIGSGTTGQSVSASLTGLATGATYYYRVAAGNGSGTIKGSILSFTPGAAPVAATAAATSVGVSTATLNGNVTANGLATDAWFEWGTSASLSTFNNTAFQAVGTGTASQPVNAGLTGLSAGTTYFYRAAASNGSGTTKGSILSFTPGAAPVAVTAGATSVGVSTAILNGNVTPNGLATDAWFEWGTSSTLSTFDNTAFQAVGFGTASQPVNSGLTGLSAGTAYYYRVAARNGSGMTRGSILSFTTGAAPAVTTLAATSVGVSAATLNGNVTPNGLATDAWFEWGTSSTLSTFDNTANQAVGSGTAGQPVNTGLTGLSGGTTYYYRVAAANASGTQKGSIASFSTLLGNSAPISTSLPATLITTGAICNGKVNPNGLPSTAWLEWGTDPALSSYNSSTSQSIGSGITNKYMNEPLTGLAAGTTYYCRVAGNNSKGTTRGTIESFTASTGTWGHFDDFSTDTTGTYTVFRNLGTESLSYDSIGKKARVATGDGGNLIFTHSLPGGYTGAFSIDFSPTGEYGSGGNIKIRIMDTPLTYYELSTSDGWIVKSRRGVAVDTVPFPYTYSQGGTYTIKITVDQMVTTIEAFGGRASLTLDTAANPVNYFEIWSTRQDADYDNIRLAVPQ